jgi:hypothetical protein
LVALRILPVKKFVAIVLVGQLVLLTAPAQAQAQVPAAQAQVPAAQSQAPPQAQVAAVPTVQDLKILVLEGERAINNTTRHIGIQPVVEVRDQNDRPVENATVVFRLPLSGPGGAFPGDSPTFRATSNAQGQAGATGFVPNDKQGRFDIHVTATYQNRTGEVTISQTNSPNTLSMKAPMPQKRSIFRNKYLYIGVGAAVGVGIALALTLGHSNSTKQVTVTPGTVTIGP